MVLVIGGRCNLQDFWDLSEAKLGVEILSSDVSLKMP
jgi:hypothetical protein